MDREQMDEFYAIREAACDGLRLGTYIERHRSVPVCQILILPSFENPVSWDVIRVAARGLGAQTRLYRSCWRMDIDCENTRSPVERLKHPRPYIPTIDVDWVLIDRALVETIIGRLRATPILLALASRPVGCDGVTFELSIGDFFCNARISWWCELPEEWKQIRPVVTELEGVFIQAWTTRSEPGSCT
jgi:hypothetical protein